MLGRWAIPIAGIDPAGVKLDHLHAVACRWVDDEHWRSPKDWSVRPMRSVDGMGVVEVATLTHAARDRLLDRVSAGSKVRFGGSSGTVLTDPHPVARADWAEFMGLTAASSWDVHFLTPTAFGNGSRFSPWPDPFAMGRSLIQRWNAVHPDGPIEIDPAGWRKVWVSDVDGHSEVLHLAGLTVSGYLGRIRYVCTDPSVAAVFDRLLRLAEYAGVGRYTARGLGTVAVVPVSPSVGQSVA